MTVTESIGVKAKIDWTKPVLWLFAACLVVLIVMPMSWLAVFSVTDKARHVTLMNFPKPSDSATTSSTSKPGGSAKERRSSSGERGPSVTAL